MTNHITTGEKKVLMTVSVDPGKKSVVTVFLNGDMEWQTAVNGYSVFDIHNEMKAISRQFDYDIAVLVIEDQYLGKNPQSLIRVVECRTRFQTCASQMGWPSVVIQPSIWQNALFGWKRGRERKENKAMSKWIFWEVFGFSAESEDHADSFCIGAFFLRNFSSHPGIRREELVPVELRNFF